MILSAHPIAEGCQGYVLRTIGGDLDLTIQPLKELDVAILKHRPSFQEAPQRMAHASRVRGCLKVVHVSFPQLSGEGAKILKMSM